MLYLFGMIGFVLGFAGGLAIINIFLKNHSRTDLVKNKALHKTYGIAVWVFAALGAWGGVWFYNRSFF